jgi:nitroreductase
VLKKPRSVRDQGPDHAHGMFVQNIMTAARARALDTCAQAAWSQYHQVIRSTLGVPKDEIVVCGMALGYADRDAPVNALKTERTTARDFMSFRGFQE